MEANTIILGLGVGVVLGLAYILLSKRKLLGKFSLAGILVILLLLAPEVDTFFAILGALVGLTAYQITHMKEKFSTYGNVLIVGLFISVVAMFFGNPLDKISQVYLSGFLIGVLLPLVASGILVIFFFWMPLLAFTLAAFAIVNFLVLALVLSVSSDLGLWEFVMENPSGLISLSLGLLVGASISISAFLKDIKGMLAKAKKGGKKAFRFLRRE